MYVLFFFVKGLYVPFNIMFTNAKNCELGSPYNYNNITNLPWGHMSITGYKFQNNEYLSFTYQISRIRIIYCKGIILLHSL